MPWPNSLILHYPNHFPPPPSSSSSSSSSSFPLTLTHHHHLCLSLLLLSPNNAISISLPATAGLSSPLSLASAVPTLSRWVFYDFRESSYWTRGNFIFICLFIYLFVTIKIGKAFDGYSFILFYFYINIIWFSLCLLYQNLNLNLPNMNEYIIWYIYLNIYVC